jgi:DNA-binding FrmR family transcriptional regulator
VEGEKLQIKVVELKRQRKLQQNLVHGIEELQEDGCECAAVLLQIAVATEAKAKAEPFAF